MQFLLIDVGAALAFLLGYIAVGMLERRRALVTVARRVSSGAQPRLLPGLGAGGSKGRGEAVERAAKPEQPRRYLHRLAQLR